MRDISAHEHAIRPKAVRGVEEEESLKWEELAGKLNAVRKNRKKEGED